MTRVDMELCFDLYCAKVGQVLRGAPDGASISTIYPNVEDRQSIALTNLQDRSSGVRKRDGGQTKDSQTSRSRVAVDDSIATSSLPWQVWRRDK
ncbi:MAG: hypothetical protein J7641_22780 [Cyanobacteria bacterium SID2]|nr:hypothetical protein [Cyanobacteria bacterium SID2]MBP0003997.1 hypothetical protein [Cyanobacteria bacterium SBC]